MREVAVGLLAWRCQGCLGQGLLPHYSEASGFRAFGYGMYDMVRKKVCSFLTAKMNHDIQVFLAS